MTEAFNSLSPVPGDHEVPSKRRKIDSLSYPIPDMDWSNPSSLSAMRCRILHAELAVAQFHQMKDQIEEIMREEEKSLENRIVETSETIKQLEVVQEASMWTTHDDFEAQASAKTEISQIKRRMREKFRNLLKVEPRTILSIDYHDLSSSITPKGETNELKSPENLRQPELAHMLEQNWVSQEFNCHELEKESLESQRLQSEAVVHANEFREEVQSEKNVILSLGEPPAGHSAPGEQIIVQNGLGEVDKVELVMFLPDNPEESSLNLQRYESRDSGTYSVDFTDEGADPRSFLAVSMQENGRTDAEELISLGGSSNSANNEHSSHASNSSDDKNPKTQQICQDLRVVVGHFYVLASSPKFFEIDWEKHYTKPDWGPYACNMCPAVRHGVSRMQDHIWAQHYTGCFHCPFCPKLWSSLSRHAGVHMRTRHGIVPPMRK